MKVIFDFPWICTTELRYRNWMWVHCCLIDQACFSLIVHCRPIINKTVLLLDDWRHPFPPVFIHFLHYSLYSSHSHIPEIMNKKVLLAGSLQGPLILQVQGAKGTNIVCWMQDRLEPSQWSILTFVHSSFFFLLLDFYASKLPQSRNFIQYNSFFQKIFFDLGTGSGAYPWSERKPRLVPPSSGSTEMYQVKRVKDLVI